LERATSFKSNNSKRNLFSFIGGTEAYMAPEIMKHYLQGTLPEKNKDIEDDKK